jgi:hypothetical protein
LLMFKILKKFNEDKKKKSLVVSLT